MRAIAPRVVACLAATLAVLGAAGPAVAADASAREIAAALHHDPVFVDESASNLMSKAEIARLRAQIAKRDPRRIQVVVISKRRSARSGGLSAIANAIDQAWGQGRRGALVASDSTGFYMVTSFDNPEPTTAALRAAVDGYKGHRLGGVLSDAVDAIADVEPGHTADLAERVGHGSAGPPGGESTVTAKDVSGSVSIALIVIAVAVAVPLLLLGGGLFLRWRRARASASDARTIALRDARAALESLGDDITAMDLDTEMPGASAAGRADYNRAVELYQRVSRALDDRDPSDAELADVQRSLQEGRTRIESARVALEA
jgi:hypothetical protein